MYDAATDKAKISGYRAAVIERAINIEWIICAIICQHYLGKVTRQFLLEVLYDEYFSFALKRRILEKIVPGIDNRLVQNINRANTIRNYFAHCNQLMIEGNDPTSAESVSRIIDPRRLDEEIDFEQLHNEFMEIAGAIEIGLVDILKDEGGEVKEADDFSKQS